MNFRFSKFLVYLLLVALNLGCSEQESERDVTLFTEMPGDSTGINFINKLSFDENFNVYTYRNFYNVGGVALGDINNDGLIDIYFTGNQVPNKLYLNKGDFKFEDITERAGVAGEQGW